MALLRMLPAAWIASLYTSALLILLIFFLNPALPLHPANMVSLAPMAVLFSLPPTLFWPAGYRFVRVFARRRLRVRWFSFKYLLGFGCANLVVVAGLYGYNADLLQGLLREANASRLRVAVAMTSLACGVFLAVALSKRLRASKRVRIACYLAATLLPITLAAARGGVPRDSVSPYQSELAPVSPEAPRLLILGVEGATLDQILPLVAQGKLPHLAQLLQGGAHGRLSSFKPCVSAVVWQSLLTGKLPASHQVMDSLRYPLPSGKGEIRLAPRGVFFPVLAKLSGLPPLPQGSPQSKALTLVEILNHLGYASLFFSERRMPPSAEGRGAVPLDRFLNPEVPSPPGAHELKELLRQALAEDEAIASSALTAWRNPEIRGVVALLTGLDKVSHQFLRFAEPASFGDVSAEEVQKYGRVMEWYYRYLDEWIGKFLSGGDPTPGASGEEAPWVMIISPHGIDPLPLGRRLLKTLEGERFESGYHERAPDGMLAVSGPGVGQRKPLGRSSILDITPTVLYELGLPVALDMDGHPLTRLFEDVAIRDKPVLLIPSYEGSRFSPPGAETPQPP